MVNKNEYNWRDAFLIEFYRATRMHSASNGVARCPSVRLSVRLSHAGIVSKRLYISSKFIHHLVAPRPTPNGMTVFRRGPPQRKRRMQGGMKKSRFSTNISLYLANDARQSHSYYGRWIGNRTQSFKWYRFEWFWLTSSPDFKVTILFNVK